MSIFSISAAILATLVLAYGAGQFTSKSISTEITINAPAADVWEHLAATGKYGDWNPFIKRLDGTFDVGSRLSATIQGEGQKPMDFAPTVLVSTPDQELRWVGKLGLPGLFDGEHYFILEDQGDGTTLFRHGETFRGMLVYALYPLIGDSTVAGFKAMNTALKARAEASA